MPRSEVIRLDDRFYMHGSFCARRSFYNSAHEHTHDFIELVYIIKGKATHTVNGKRYALSSGDVLFMNYHCVHSFESASGFEYADILMKPEFVCESLGGSENAFSLLTIKDFEEFAGSALAENCAVSFSRSEKGLVEGLIDLMCKESSMENKGAMLLSKSALNVLLTLVFRKMSLPMHGEMGMDESLLAYIREKCGSCVTLEELAEKCFYNPAYFSRRFKAYTGVTFTEYLTECRIARAKEMLTQTELSVESIIGECGYSNRTKFFEDFSKRVGCTPLKYRKSKK